MNPLAMRRPIRKKPKVRKPGGATRSLAPVPAQPSDTTVDRPHTGHRMSPETVAWCRQLLFFMSVGYTFEAWYEGDWWRFRALQTYWLPFITTSEVFIGHHRHPDATRVGWLAVPLTVVLFFCAGLISVGYEGRWWVGALAWAAALAASRPLVRWWDGPKPVEEAGTSDRNAPSGGL